MINFITKEIKTPKNDFDSNLKIYNIIKKLRKSKKQSAKNVEKTRKNQLKVGIRPIK